MPRFKLKTALATVAIVAAWLATGRVETNLGIGLRTIFWFFLFAVPTLVAVHSRGSQRAFWLGAVFALVMRGIPKGSILYKYSLKVSFAHEVGHYFRQFASRELSSAVSFTVSDTLSIYSER